MKLSPVKFLEKAFIPTYPTSLSPPFRYYLYRFFTSLFPHKTNFFVFLPFHLGTSRLFMAEECAGEKKAPLEVRIEAHLSFSPQAHTYTPNSL